MPSTLIAPRTIAFSPIALLCLACYQQPGLDDSGTESATAPMTSADDGLDAADDSADTTGDGGPGMTSASTMPSTDGSDTDDCPGGQLSCGGACIDPSDDPMFCGASGDCEGAGAGTACGAGQRCVDGACVPTCSGNEIACDGACIDPMTSQTHCGASGNCQGANAGQSCTGSQTCTSGNCAALCDTDEVACGGGCIDPLTDQTFCGASDDCAGANAGTTCTATQQCVSSQCITNLTPNGDGYGHHGACEGWNECNDAQTCAQWACQINGYATAVSWGVEAPCTTPTFTACHLFFDMSNLETNWGLDGSVCGNGWCEDIMCVGDIWCA